ncbi:MAG: PaaI family thioesterase [Chloroflexia bacterium]|nr:PaaI family thioesterase [Chloroflexia bacterium]
MPYEAYCFACGKQNPIGLQLEFERLERGVRARFVPTEVYQGYPGLMHGGLVATLLDEAMAHAVLHAEGLAVTGELKVRMRGQGVPIGAPVLVRGRVTGRRGRLVWAEAEVRDEQERILAQGQGKFMLVPGA